MISPPKDNNISITNKYLALEMMQGDRSHKKNTHVIMSIIFNDLYKLSSQTLKHRIDHSMWVFIM